MPRTVAERASTASSVSSISIAALLSPTLLPLADAYDGFDANYNWTFYGLPVAVFWIFLPLGFYLEGLTNAPLGLLAKVRATAVACAWFVAQTSALGKLWGYPVPVGHITVGAPAIAAFLISAWFEYPAVLRRNVEFRKLFLASRFVFTRRVGTCSHPEVCWG